jgi:putative ubiquitin-RnfH superfamily antitoxin RatB of RatAB toxin-antitoxin module
MSDADTEASASEEKIITVEVAYALPQRQKIVALQVPLGTTAMEAVMQSGIADLFPEIDPATAKMGIFGQALGNRGLKAAPEYVLEPMDRVEIYRPLIADPKEVRKRRAEKAKAEHAATDEK